MTLAERLRAALARGHDGLDLVAGDHADLAARAADTLTPAAVLVPITDRADPGVILTQRTASMRTHAGQIAFPGGRIDSGDRDAVAAALREAEEEIGLPPPLVEVAGTADRYRTVTGFDVTPVIGVVPPDLYLRPAEAEVAAVFEVPLGFLLDRANHHRAHMDRLGERRDYWEIRWGEHRIWGATAAMIVNLARRLRWS
ncbi:CoA pyrophosphatase [uncultured Sphingomonas sp.]|uniref:CoA pyrophosphatase n=1 Tax=uncultured Sphingomonas sp. TaxID=158754 RepID=UPI0035CC957C